MKGVARCVGGDGGRIAVIRAQAGDRDIGSRHARDTVSWLKKNRYTRCAVAELKHRVVELHGLGFGGDEVAALEAFLRALVSLYYHIGHRGAVWPPCRNGDVLTACPPERVGVAAQGGCLVAVGIRCRHIVFLHRAAHAEGYGLYTLPVAVHGGAGGGRGCHGLQAGGVDYQWILAFGQRAAAEVVLRAGSRRKKQDGCRGQYMQWKSIAHILSLLGMIYLKVCVHVAAIHRVPVADSG